MTAGWAELLPKLYSSKSLMTMIKSRMMRFAGHAARTGRTEIAYTALVDVRRKQSNAMAYTYLGG
jgi:hypothetical protein